VPNGAPDPPTVTPAATVGDVPVLDVAALRHEPSSAAAQECIARIDAACVDSGFFVVVGHGLDLDPIFAAAHRFFALPDADKARSAMIGNNGYAGANSPRTGGKEMLDIGLTGFERWPALPGFRDTVARYQAAALALAGDLLQGLARALTVEPTFFADRMRAPQCFLRMLRYPARPPTGAAAMAAGAHTDYGAITLLATDGVAGLEVLPRGESWRPVVAPAGSLVVNLGDMLARWTNGRYVSTPHRVLAVPEDRYSIPFFVNPDPDTVVACIPSCVSADRPCAYAPITAGEFLQARIDGTIPSGDGTHA
jgi:isopenicillin N synthase-like dioxygenase